MQKRGVRVRKGGQGGCEPSIVLIVKMPPKKSGGGQSGGLGESGWL